MNLRHVLAILLRQLYLIRGSISRIMPLFVWVALDIVLWGFFTKYLNSITDSGLNFTTAILGAVLLWNFFTRVMHGVTMAFLEDVWSRNFLNIFASPLSIPEYILGLVLSSIATSLVGLIVMLALATTVFAYGLMLLPFILILFLFGIALGITGCAVVLRFGPAAEWFIWPIPALISPFAGVFYPLSVLPKWMYFIAHLIPPAYVFESMRAITAGSVGSLIALLCGGSLAIPYIFLAGWFFMHTYLQAIETGLIARYSAESLS